MSTHNLEIYDLFLAGLTIFLAIELLLGLWLLIAWIRFNREEKALNQQKETQ